MRMQTCEKSVAALKRVRDACCGQLDVGALAELDEVIQNLQLMEESCQNAEEVERLKLRTLQALAAFVTIATNIREWLQ